VTILLLRHGQTDWNVEPARCQGWQDVGLNETGRTQARAGGRALRGCGVELIVTSHLRRARETAELVREELLRGAGGGTGGGTSTAAAGRGTSAAAAGRGTSAAAEQPATASVGESSASVPPRTLQIVVDPRLAETHRGRWEGRLFVDIVHDEPDVWRAYRERPETFRFPGGESLAEQQRRVLAALRDAALDGRTVLAVTHGGAIRMVCRFLEHPGVETFRQPPADNGGVVEILDPGLAERVTAALAGNL